MNSDSRHLLFQEGSSNKFWSIEWNGDSHTVTFGRIGTAGQSQTKSFETPQAAKKSFDKLINEKLGKGYVEDPTKQSPGSSPATTMTSPSKPSEKQASSGKKTQSKGDVASKEESNQRDSSPTQSTKDSSKISRSIALTEFEWLLAPFRNQGVIDRGSPPPFDLESCKKKLGKLKTECYGWDIQWEGLSLPMALTREESHFWLQAMTYDKSRETKMPDMAKAIGKLDCHGDLELKEVIQAMFKPRRGGHAWMMLPVANLIPPVDLIEAILNRTSSKKSDERFEPHELARGFHRFLRPFLTPQEVDSIRAKIGEKLDFEEVFDCNESYPIAYYLAASMGMHSELSRLISSWEDDYFQRNVYADRYQYPQTLVCGLQSSEAIEAEWRRLRLQFHTVEQAKMFLACTEYSALDILAGCICLKTNKEECESLLSVLRLVNAPDAAEPMLRCKLECKTPAPAREWLDENVANAMHGLVSTACMKGKLGEAALELLRSFKRDGHEELLRTLIEEPVLQEFRGRIMTDVIEREEKVYSPLAPTNTPSWLTDALGTTGGSKKKLPFWAKASQLPPLVVGKDRLNDDQVERVLQALSTTDITAKDPLLSAIRENVPKHSRDSFAWKLFEHWAADGSQSKDKWAMGAIGHLGEDGSVLQLTPLIRAWPGESQHQRAVFGLECLRAIGSNVALMQLSGIAQKLKFKGLKAKAEQFVAEIAKEKGMTRDELEDRVIPDCGLDEQGKREFSFGSRSFSFVLGGDLKAMVRDESGKVRSDLPVPSGKDQAEVAAESIAEWKLLKKQIKEVATIQARRLENAMITGRRFLLEEFDPLLVRHPLMTHLAQKLIWGAYQADGKRIATFRVTEEKDYADPEDQAISLPSDCRIGIIHPLEMNDSERNGWGQVLSDYEIISPFSQLGREVHRLEKNEESKTSLDRFNGIKLAAPTLVFTMEKLGWVRGIAMDAGCFDEHSKQFPAADVTAVLNYEGTVGMGYIDPDEELTIQSLSFIQGMRPPSCYGWGDEDKKTMTLGDVHEIVLSEVLADMQLLKSKAR